MELTNQQICVSKQHKNLNFTVYSKSFDADYDHIVDNSVGVAIKKISQSSSNSLGLVLYAEPTFYDSDSVNLKNLHLPGVTTVDGREVYKQVFDDYFNNHFGIQPVQITFGHEHGTTNFKCHLQICVEFDKIFRGTVKPGLITFSLTNNITDEFSCFNTNLLFMAQKARNPGALKRYCMKDGDFFYLFPEKALKLVYKKDSHGVDTKKVDPFSTIVQNKNNLSIEQAKEICLTYEPRTACTMYKNLEYCFNSELTSSLPALQWTYPSHLKGVYPLIEKWFHTWCVPEDLLRRKALLLYSEKRCLGKTEFAFSLVNHPSYVVVFRNSFVDSMKDKVPKLLVLDDMSPYTKQNKETWKALVASQPTSIRDAYCNYNWDFRIPCIITTNNLFLCSQLFKSPEFKTQIMFQEITDYMGPPGTQPTDMVELEYSFTSDMESKIQQMIFDSEKKFEEEKYLGKKTSSMKDLDLEMKFSQLQDENRLLKMELAKLKKSK